MISTRNRLRSTFFVSLLTVVPVSMQAGGQGHTAYRMKSGGELRRVTVAQADPRTMLAQGDRFAVIRKGDTIERMRPLPAVASLAATGAYQVPETYWAHEHGTGAVIEFRPVIVLGAPMRFDPATNDFRGSLGIFLEEAGQAVQRTLADPIQILVTTRADQVSPTALALDHTYLPPAEVRLVSGNPQDSIEVRFITAANTAGYAALIPVEPSLTIQVGQARLQAYGIEKSSLVITRRPLGAGTPPVFRVTATSGYVSPEEIDLQSGQASVSVRSAGVGTAMVRVVGPGYRTAEAALEYVFPWAFLIAALAGTGVGTLIRTLRTPKSNVRLIIRRILFGLVVVAAWAIAGLNLLNLELPPYYNEGLVFVLGGLASMGWTSPKPGSQ